MILKKGALGQADSLDGAAQSLPPSKMFIIVDFDGHICHYFTSTQPTHGSFVEVKQMLAELS